MHKDKDGKRGFPSSFLGYGYCESPNENEINMPEQCDNSGYFQYSILKKIVSQNDEKYTLDEESTSKLIKHLARSPSIKKIFIEPHLKKRWNLKNDKVKFHGCHAVRHDDHIHIQL